jgi:hypothetical protein
MEEIARLKQQNKSAPKSPTGTPTKEKVSTQTKRDMSPSEISCKSLPRNKSSPTALRVIEEQNEEQLIQETCA